MYFKISQVRLEQPLTEIAKYLNMEKLNFIVYVYVGNEREFIFALTNSSSVRHKLFCARIRIEDVP